MKDKYNELKKSLTKKSDDSFNNTVVVKVEEEVELLSKYLNTAESHLKRIDKTIQNSEFGIKILQKYEEITNLKKELNAPHNSGYDGIKEIIKVTIDMHEKEMNEMEKNVSNLKKDISETKKLIVRLENKIKETLQVGVEIKPL